MGRFKHHVRTLLRCLPLVFPMLLLPSVGLAEMTSMPALAAKSLTGATISLPDNNGRPVVLVFGFSRAAKPEGVAWGTRLLTYQVQMPGFDFYQVAVLSGAPRFARGWIASAIRREVPPSYRSHFLLVSEGGSEWQRTLHAESDASTYVVLCSRDGHILWQTKGTDEANFQGLNAELHKVLN